MKFYAAPNSSTRHVLQRLCTACANHDITNLLKFDCEATEYEHDSRGLTLTLWMRNAAACDRLRGLLPLQFAKLKLLYAQEAGTVLFNLRATSP